MSAIDKEPFPRGALLAAASLVVFSLVAAGLGSAAKHDRLSTQTVVRSEPATTLDMAFTDDASGAVHIRDARTGEHVLTLAPGADGFIRSVVRGLVRDRRSRGIDQAPPFRLSQWANGDLVLEDTATGKQIDLRAFGATNKEAFARILDAKDALG